MYDSDGSCPKFVFQVRCVRSHYHEYGVRYRCGLADGVSDQRRVAPRHKLFRPSHPAGTARGQYENGEGHWSVI